MTSKTFGYARVSSVGQGARGTYEYQYDALAAAGVAEGDIYCDIVSGKDFTARPQWDNLCGKLREGDTVVVRELSRLGRNTAQTLELLDNLQARGVAVRSLSEGITIDETPMGRCFATICCAFAQMETDLRSERCSLGLAAARENGVRVGRPPATEKQGEALDTAVRLYAGGGLSVSAITSRCGVSRATLYREIKRRGASRVAES